MPFSLLLSLLPVMFGFIGAGPSDELRTLVVEQEVIMDVRGHKTLWAYPLDGSPAARAFEFSEPDVRIDYPTWSPDGRWVLFDRAAPLGGDLWTMEGLE